MDALECILSRRSIRQYSEQAVEWEKVGILLEAAMQAPSAGNLQNWGFIIVLDKDARAKMAEACLQQHWMATAPVHIVVCSEPEKADKYYGIRGERLYSIQNCAAAVQNMLLAAYAQGLSSCWVGAFDEEIVKRVLAIPDNVRPQAILPIGYSDEKPGKTTRQPLYDKVFIGSWGGRIKDIQHVMGYHSAKVQKIAQSGKALLQGEHNEKIKRTFQKGKEFLSGIRSKVQKKKE